MSLWHVMAKVRIDCLLYVLPVGQGGSHNQAHVARIEYEYKRQISVWYSQRFPDAAPQSILAILDKEIIDFAQALH